MSNVLLVSVSGPGRRVALMENGVTTEVMMEASDGRRIVGNVYKGKVVRVLPGMQSAFIEMGLHRTAFLFARDLSDEMWISGDDNNGSQKTDVPINQRLSEGQSIVVQVAKEPLGQKGARVTNQLSLPGRFLVALPTVNHVGVSRRISDEAERKRLRSIAEDIAPEDMGLIVRTAGEGASREALTDDLEFLRTLWADLKKKADTENPPTLLYEELDLTLKAVRDLLQPSFDAVYVDCQDEYQRIADFIETFMPRCRPLLKHYYETTPLFTRYGVEREISRAMNHKVWLKSGGYIVIDRAEALTSIDVNSGRYVGKTNFEDTILKINLEAVKEIAYQLRLRNIGGIIVLDFIDMAEPANQALVQETLMEAMEADRVRCNVLPMSPLGLVEMTRKRVGRSLSQMMTENCEHCDGQGWTLNRREITRQILQKILDTVASRQDTAKVTVRAHPKVVEALYDEYQPHLLAIEKRTDVEIEAEHRDHFHLEQYEVRGH